MNCIRVQLILFKETHTRFSNDVDDDDDDAEEELRIKRYAHTHFTQRIHQIGII